MTRYFISFDDGSMTLPESDLPAVADAAHAVLAEAKRAGAWITGGGILHSDTLTSVGTDGVVSEIPYCKPGPHVGGFAILSVASRDEALEWAAKFAEACRCAQEVWELMDDPEA